MIPHNIDLDSLFPLWGYRARTKGVVEIKTRYAVEVEIITHALTSANFRQELLRAPRAALRSEMDLELAPELTLSVVEESEDRVYLVIPDNPYPGIDEKELLSTLGITFHDVAAWLIGGNASPNPATQARIALTTRAWTDEDFRDALRTRPREALEDQLGELAADEREVVVLWEEPCSVWLVIPAAESLDYAGTIAGTADDQDWLRVNVAQGGSAGELTITKKWVVGTDGGGISVCCKW